MNSPDTPELFHVYKRGRLTVIGFDGRHLDNDLYSETVRQQLSWLVDHHDCEMLVVDLMDVKTISSWILGVLAAIQRNGIDVELYHPSIEIQNRLNVMNLSAFLHVRGAAS